MIQLGIDAGGLMFKFGALIILPVVAVYTLKCGNRNSYKVCSNLKFIFFWFSHNNVIAFFFIICTITIGGNFQILQMCLLTLYIG